MSKKPEFEVFFLGIVMLKLAFEADLELKVVLECLCVIAALLRSVMMSLVGHKTINILKDL